jgi:hypothetical protein
MVKDVTTTLGKEDAMIPGTHNTAWEGEEKGDVYDQDKGVAVNEVQAAE